MRPCAKTLVLLVLLVGARSWVAADVKLPRVFSDNMVVQQKMKIPVWGWAAPGEQVTVTLGASKGTDTAAADGKWLVRLDPLAAGGPFDLTVAGKNTLTVKNVLVGEVYIASGQSNMEFTERGAKNAAQEAAAANYPLIRMFTVTKNIASGPQSDCEGSWQVCTPATVPGFSAVGYFFAVNLQKALNVPVGIIHTSWGGTPIQSWTDLQSLEDEPALKTMGDQTAAYFAAYSKQLAAIMHEWLPTYEGAVAAGKTPPAAPPLYNVGGPGAGSPTGLYNAMIAPLVPYGIAGALWYQGESDAGNPMLYRTQLPTMIKGWRRLWGEGDFGFFIVQLANYTPQVPQPTADGGWAAQRESQALALALPKTGMACIIDIGDGGNIHPTDKQDVGLRLALAAEKVQYGMDVVYSGPTYAAMKVEGNKVRISFDNLGGGLVVKGGGPLQGFAIAGADKKLVWADATIDGDTVLVSSAQVPQPTIVRYAFESNPVCNLYNKADLPAVPFRTDAPK